MCLVITFVGFADPHLLDRLHGPRAGLRALLRLPEPVLRRDADPGPGRQPAGDVHRLGGRRPVQLPADRLLVHERAPTPTPARRRSSSTASATSASCSACSCCSSTTGTLSIPGHQQPRPTPGGPLIADAVAGPAGRLLGGAVPVHRRLRQVGADPALRLAARRDGRPDAGLGADPRRHHGDRRRLHGRAHARSSTRWRRRRWRSSRWSARLTALFAAIIGFAQNDFKKVLAYSTVSQLGFMFVGRRHRRTTAPASSTWSPTPSSRPACSCAPAR